MDIIKLLPKLSSSKTNVIVKSDSLLAKIACRKMKSSAVAMVLGKTIHLYGVSPSTLLNNIDWLSHELIHVRQYEEYGFIRFVVLYLWEWMKHGYHNNRYEIEACDRTKQLDVVGILDKYNFKIK